MTVYNVKNQWGGPTAPWRDGGTWSMGGLDGQFISLLQLISTDIGISLTGKIAFDGGEAVDCRAEEVDTNRYRVQACWSGVGGEWP